MKQIIDRVVLDRRNNNRIFTYDLVKKAKLVLTFAYFSGKVKREISGAVIERKFAPTYACMFIDETETLRTLAIDMGFSLFEHMRMKDLRSFLITLTVITLILKSLMILIKSIFFGS